MLKSADIDENNQRRSKETGVFWVGGGVLTLPIPLVFKKKYDL